MLFFQIDSYNLSLCLSFETKEKALQFLVDHPETEIGTKIQIYKDGTKNRKEMFANNGVYTVTTNGHNKLRLVDYDVHSGLGKSFKDIFGTCKSTRGSIQNKILLDFWKTRFKRDLEIYRQKVAATTDPKELKDLSFFKACRAGEIQDVQSLYNLILSQISTTRPKDAQGNNLPSSAYGTVQLKLGDKHYNLYCTKYTSSTSGSSSSSQSLSFCSDYRCVTCIDRKTNKRCFVKASKIILDAIETSRAVIGQAATIYMAEEFQRRWETEQGKLLGGLHLVVDDHFDYIYDQNHCAGNFGSCMTGKHQYRFYNESVDASAAYITDDNQGGKIVARCILYHNVERDDTPGKTFNYAERQYSISDFYKHVLVAKLIESGQADLYKTIGASCHDIQAIMDKNGKRLGNPRLTIKAKKKLQRGDTCSYLDTFMYYYPQEQKFRNFVPRSSEDFYRELNHTANAYSWDD